jgi:hypothetical protein
MAVRECAGEDRHWGDVHWSEQDQKMLCWAHYQEGITTADQLWAVWEQGISRRECLRRAGFAPDDIGARAEFRRLFPSPAHAVNGPTTGHPEAA